MMLSRIIVGRCVLNIVRNTLLIHDLRSDVLFDYAYCHRFNHLVGMLQHHKLPHPRFANRCISDHHSSAIANQSLQDVYSGV